MSTVNTAAPAAAPAPAESSASPETNEIETSAAEGQEAEATEEAPATPTAAEKKAANKKKFALKVDGRDEELELDLDNEEELKKHLQFSRVANKRMQEMAEYKKGVNGLIDALKSNPLAVLSDPRLGIPEEVRKQMAEAIINEQIEDMQKTPEQKEKERLQREYEMLKKQVEEEKTAREQAEFARMQEQAAVQLDAEITEAISTSGLPKSSRTVRHMAEAMMFCLENNIDLSPKDLVPLIKKNTLSEFREIIASLPDEDFEGWLGKDQIGRIRKRSMAKLKETKEASANNPANIQPTGKSNKKVEEAPKKIAFKDFMKSLGK